MLLCVLLPPGVETSRLFAVSPLVERDGDLAFLETAGLQRLHGGARGLFAAVQAALAPLLPLGLALASNRFTAEVAARHACRPVLVPPGDEGLFLANLPLTALPLSPTLQRRLLPLGLASLGDFAALPAAAVARRYGPEGVALHRLARGEDETLLAPLCQERPLAVARELDGPAADLAALRPALEESALRLCALLVERDQGVTKLSLDLGGQHYAVAPAAPEQRVRLLVDLLALRIEARPPGAPVTELVLEATELAPLSRAQAALFVEPPRERAREDEALSRLAVELGPTALRTPRLRPAHRLEERWVEQGKGSPVRSGFAAPALRLLRPPETLVPVHAGNELLAFRRGRASLDIAWLSPPRRLVGGWWDRPWARDEHELGTPDGGLYRVARDLYAKRWLLLAETD